MKGIEVVTALFCLGMCVSLIVIAWWVSRISSALASMRDADKLARETQGRSILTWVITTAENVKELVRRQHAVVQTLEDLHVLLDPSGERPTIAAIPPLPQEPPPAASPSSDVIPAPHLAPAPEDRLNSAESGCWTGPPSNRTLIGGGAAQVNGQEVVPTPPSKVLTR
jgi:hypothetical protein